MWQSWIVLGLMVALLIWTGCAGSQTERGVHALLSRLEGWFGLDMEQDIGLAARQRRLNEASRLDT